MLLHHFIERGLYNETYEQKAAKEAKINVGKNTTDAVDTIARAVPITA